ncbi:MAG: dipeptidyl-peptidase 3 family protein [Bacteroidales bacterium]
MKIKLYIMKNVAFIAMILLLAISCKSNKNVNVKELSIEQKVEEFVEVELKAEISGLKAADQQMLLFLFKAAKIMDNIFWQQAFGDKSKIDALENKEEKAFAYINYGPWERLNGNKPFIKTYAQKPKGANFYPVDMTAEEFERFADSTKTSLYTMIRRDSTGQLTAIPYHKFFKTEIEEAVEYIRIAATYATDKGLHKYLVARAAALLSDDYFESDIAWMEMRTNPIDFVIGPIENYEDALYGYKAAYESFILLKDLEWSTKLEHLNALMPALQAALPCEAEYKSEVPGKDSDLGVYQVVYYAGDCNAGSKTIAINLPNDERVHVQKGTRKLQLKNAMKAKFDKILMPIAEELIDTTQLKDVKFDAFFENVMYHEVLHGLGVKQTINGKGSARNALKETYSSIEEAKADIGGLFLVDALAQINKQKPSNLLSNYVTFVAGIFRSVRFGASSAHGKANMLTFNYLSAHGAFVKGEDGRYKIDVERMQLAINSMLAKILKMQGEGDYEGAKEWITQESIIGKDLAADLSIIATAGIPRDIRFIQGEKVLGLE